MKTTMYRWLPVVLVASLLLPAAAEAADRPLAHMVYFTLKDKSPDAKEAFVAACLKYLSKHEGTVYFSVGVRAEEFDREVNDVDFDVALHLVFKNKAAHDTYLTHPRHLKFLEENKELWSKARVFDSYLAGAARQRGRAKRR
jgi:hypothetical protein